MEADRIISLKLNGSEVIGQLGMTVLELAETQGVYIPTICHDPNLRPVGACRICLVEDERTDALIASCVTPIAPGMVINTQSTKVIETRKVVVKLLLASHPDSCLVCDKGNQCKLRKIASELEIGQFEFTKVRRYYPIEAANPFIERDLSKCVLCGKCVRACKELQMVGAIDYAYRGFKTKPATPLDRPLEESNCEFCGLCTSICPVGALSDKLSKYEGVEKKSVCTICPYCGCGCGIYLKVRDNKVMSVSADSTHPVNKATLCVKGRYGYEFINSPQRLKTPLIKKDGEFIQSSWEEALDFVATILSKIKQEYGSNSLAGLGSGRCTNEENYLFQKFLRAVLGTNNIDNHARLSISPSLEALERAFGSPAVANSIEEIEGASLILVIGANVAESQPLVGQKIKRAIIENGAKLIVVDPRAIKLTKLAHLWLRLRPGTDIALINGLMNVIFYGDIWDKEFVAQRTEGFSSLIEVIEKYTPDYVEGITGVAAQDIHQAAELYAKADRALIIYGTGITQHTTGTYNVLSLVNLVMLTGHVKKESCGFYQVGRQNNLLGACDMGALPDRLPGYQRVNNPEHRERFEKEWGVNLPYSPGLTAIEMVQAAKEGRIKGMYIMGENLLLNYPDLNAVVEALKSLDFLVVQDIFLTETAGFADVILPATSFAEKDGTFTTMDRRIQRIRKAIDPIGESKPDWKIISELATKMGYPMEHESAEKIMEEIARLTPIYGGVSYDRLEDSSLSWFCSSLDHPGTRSLHKDSFMGGRGKFTKVEYKTPAELPDEKYPFILTTGENLYHSGTGTMTRNSCGLSRICPEGFVEVSFEDAKILQVEDGEVVKIVSKRGQMKTKVRVTKRVQKGVLFMPLFSEEPVNVLTNQALDPVAKIPGLKVCAVDVRRADDQ